MSILPAKTPNLTMSANVAPPAARASRRFSKTRSVWATGSPQADQLALLLHRDLAGDRHHPSPRADSVAVPVAGRHPSGAR